MEPNEKDFILQNLNNIHTPKIVLVFAMNEVDQSKVIQQLISSFSKNKIQKSSLINNSACYPFPNHSLINFDVQKFPALKSIEPMFFVNCPRDLSVFLNYLKVADFVIGVSSLGHTDFINLNKVPEDAINIIDSTGNQAIALMRSQGQLPFLSVITDVSSCDKHKLKSAKFYSSRLISEEFNKDTPCYFLENNDDLLKVVHDIHKRKTVQILWRSQRGYFLVDKLELQSSSDSVPTLKLSGFLRNTWGPENLVHITGYGDAQTTQIECEVEVKSKSIGRLIKVPRKTDDWRVFNDLQSDPTIEHQIIEEENQANDDFIVDELADLKKEFQQLQFTQNDG